jgi:myo-inositol 2-dehydrogenase / D-chiro-inositol 1-dehydrogenase
MSNTGSIGVGVIGCGTIAYWAHLRTLRKMPAVRVAGLIDPDPRALARANRLVNASTYDSVEALLRARDVDAVVIASPTHLHSEHVIAACAASKHVYLEKPMAIDKPSVLRTAAAIEDAGIRFAVGFNRRFHPAFQRGRELLRDGAIGKVKTVLSSFSEPLLEKDMPEWKRNRQTGGGVLLDLGIHHFDLYRWFLDDEFEEIHAQIESISSDQETAFVRIRMQKNTNISGYFSFTSSRSDYLEFHGDLGILRIDLHRGSLEWRKPRRLGYGVRRRFTIPRASDIPWKLRKFISPSFDPSYGRALHAFMQTVRRSEATAAPLAGIEDGVRSMQAVLAAEESALSGIGVRLSRD